MLPFLFIISKAEGKGTEVVHTFFLVVGNKAVPQCNIFIMYSYRLAHTASLGCSALPSPVQSYPV